MEIFLIVRLSNLNDKTTELLLKSVEKCNQQSEMMGKLAKTSQQIALANGNIVTQFTFLQKYQEMIQPFAYIVSAFNARYDEALKLSNKFVESTKIYTAIEKLSMVNYVFWEFIPMKLAEQLCAFDDANIVLEKYELQTDGIETKEIFDLCLKSDFLKPREILFSQSFGAYLNKQYNLAVIGLFSIIDGVLSEILVDSNIRKNKLKKRCERLLDK